MQDGIGILYRLLRIGWMVVVVGGGLVLALLTLLADEPAGAAVLAGIALTAALASALLPAPPARRGSSRGFQPRRRRH